MTGMLLAEIAATSADVASTSSRLAKVARLTECLHGASPEEVAVAVSYLSGELPQGTVGVGWAGLKNQSRWSGSVQARKTLSRGASRTRVRVKPRWSS